MSEVYTSLEHPKSQIRLARLAPGPHEAEINCTLVHVSLQDAPVYFALSYAWGDLSKSRPIYLNGSKVQVTENLEEALRDLRLENKELFWWADGICINQSDDIEKSQQVALMGSIYENAGSVIIYLGGRKEDGEARASILSKFIRTDQNLSHSRFISPWHRQLQSTSVEHDRQSPIVHALMYLSLKARFWGLGTTLKSFAQVFPGDVRPSLAHGELPLSDLLDEKALGELERFLLRPCLSLYNALAL